MEPGPATGQVGSAWAPFLCRPRRRSPAAGESREFDGMELVWIPVGEFLMGSTSGDASDDEQPVTRVRTSRGLWLGKHEVTQDEWQEVTGAAPYTP